MQNLPMFPLGTVLLPRERLPLQVFEPRYVAMLEHCLSAEGQGRFGVVLISRGHEVGGGDQRTDIGTVARILRCVPVLGNRFALVAVGEERIRVTRWLPDDPYPRADVEPWPDEDGSDDAAELTTVESKIAELDEAWRQLAAKSGAAVPDFPESDLPPDATERSFALASGLPISEADRQRVLEAVDPSSRLRVLAEALDDVVAGLRFRSM